MSSLSIKPRAAAANSLTTGRLPRGINLMVIGGALGVAALAFGLVAIASGDFNVAGWIVVGAIVYVIAIYVLSILVEGRRRAKDRLVTALVTGAFLIAVLPLVSVTITVVARGIARFDWAFFTNSMAGVSGEGGGAMHAIIGTLVITLCAAIISIPVGLMVAIYLVEYGRGWLARGITFLVDVMTGIPSIVAGLFAYSLFVLFLPPLQAKMGIAGALALSVLMIPVVVRSSEEMLKIVPNELREASFALGVPKWLTITKVVLPTSIAGIITGVMISIARVIGETAPLLIAAGFATSINWNPFSGSMLSLPVFTYFQYRDTGNPVEAYHDRAWASALTLIVIVMLLNIIARLISKILAPKTGR